LRVQGNTAHESGISLAIGVGFMAMGIFMAFVSLIRYRTTMKRLNADEFQPADAIVTVLAVIAALFGSILAVYLIYTSRTVRRQLFLLLDDNYFSLSTTITS
jgi:uncharacterized membrane protein YidH (DUF202 family)